MDEAKGKKLLENIDGPEDLKKFSRKELPIIYDELRDFIIDAVSFELSSSVYCARMNALQLYLACTMCTYVIYGLLSLY